MNKVNVIKIDTNPAQVSVKDLKQELKELKGVMLSCEEGTDEYNAALQRSAEITHTLKEQTEQINIAAMDFGQITTNCTNALGGMVAGFQAATAVMNLFGSENEDVIRTMKTMQQLMSLTQALPAIDKGRKAFMALAGAIKTSSTAMSGLSKAFIATGLGAIVVGLTGLITLFDKLADKQNKYVNKQKEYIKTLKEDAKKAQDEYNKSLQRELDIKEKLYGIRYGGDDVKVYTAILREYNKELTSVNNTLQNQYKDSERIDAKKRLRELNEEIKGLTEGSKEYIAKLLEITEAEAKLKDIKPLNENEIEQLTKRQGELNDKINEYSDKLREAQAVASVTNIEKVKEAYQNLIVEISNWSKSEKQLELEKIDEDEKKRVEIIRQSVKDKTLAEQQITMITEHYAQKRLDIEKKYADEALDELQKEKLQELSILENEYALQTAKLQAQYDERLISLEYFNERKTEIDKAYNDDYVDLLNSLLEDETFSVQQRIELYNKLNEARKKPLENSDSHAEVLTKALNESALALSDLSDNPAWGNILKNFALITSNWDTLKEKIKGGEEAFSAYAQIAAAGLGAVAQLMNGLAAEQDTNNKKGFEKSKKMQIAGATMQMLAGIVTAISGAFTTKTGPWDIALAAIQASMIAAVGSAQIANIAKQEYNGGSSSFGKVSTPSTAAINNVIAPVQYTQDVQGASIEESIRNQKVYVTETDITDTQNKVHVAESEAHF